RNAVVAAVPVLHEGRQRGVGRLHAGFLLLARPSLAVIEMVDIHVVVVKRPARGRGLGVIGIAVSGVEPGAAYVERHAEMRVGGPGTTADAVHRLEQLEGETRGTQRLGRGKPRRPRPDDHDVHIAHATSPSDVATMLQRCPKRPHASLSDLLWPQTSS